MNDLIGKTVRVDADGETFTVAADGEFEGTILSVEDDQAEVRFMESPGGYRIVLFPVDEAAAVASELEDMKEHATEDVTDDAED